MTYFSKFHDKHVEVKKNNATRSLNCQNGQSIESLKKSPSCYILVRLPVALWRVVLSRTAVGAVFWLRLLGPLKSRNQIKTPFC